MLHPTMRQRIIRHNKEYVKDMTNLAAQIDKHPLLKLPHGPDLYTMDIPDPEPGWARLSPERALAFLYVTPRPCSALDELMQP